MSESELRLRKFLMSAAKSDSRETSHRRDAEVRRQRREVERQMQAGVIVINICIFVFQLQY